MKLFKSLLLSVLFVAALSFTGCNEEPTTSVTPDNKTSLSKLTLPAGAVVTNATFNVYVLQNRERSVTVHKVNVPWVEATETYNTFFARPAPQWDAISLGSFDASTVGYKSVDITSLVQSWIADPTTNNGILLDQLSWPNCPGDLNLIYYHSRENVNVPYLEVTYTVGGGSPVTVQEPALGDTYLHSADPDYPRGAVDVLFQTRWDDAACTYLKLPLFKFDIEGTPVEEHCETAYAFGDTPFCGLPDISNWGWTEKIDGNYTNTNIPIYAGAAQCDPAKGTQVGTLSITYVKNSKSLSVNYTMNTGITVENVQVWIGSTPLPIKNGKYTSAPGQFTYINPTFPLNVTQSTTFYIAVHFDVCWSE